MRLLILFIISCSFVFSQNEKISKESFLDKFQYSKSEDELNSLFVLSNSEEIKSQFKKQELFGYRMLLLMDLIRLNSENQEKYLNFSIDYILKNKNLIDFDIQMSWSALIDIIALLNDFKVFKPELKNLFNKLLELSNYVREKKINENGIKLYETYDLDLALISWGLANYYDLIENKLSALENYEKTLDFLDLEKYYEVFKQSAWYCLKRSFYLNLELRNETKNQDSRKSYLKEAEEWLLFINSTDISQEEYKGAELIKYNTNRSYAYTMKDFKSERIYIDKLKKMMGENFDISVMDLTNNYNQKLITKEKYGSQLVSLYDSFKKPYDARVVLFLSNEESYKSNLKRFLKKFNSLSYFNKLSYQDQIIQYKYRFKEFMILKGEFIRLNEGLKKIHLKSFIQYLIKLENYSVNNKELFK